MFVALVAFGGAITLIHHHHSNRLAALRVVQQNSPFQDALYDEHKLAACLTAKKLSVGTSYQRGAVGRRYMSAQFRDEYVGSTGGLFIDGASGPDIFSTKPVPGRVDSAALWFFSSSALAEQKEPLIVDTQFYGAGAPASLAHLGNAIWPPPPSVSDTRSLIALAGNVVVIWDTYPRRHPNRDDRILSSCFSVSKSPHQTQHP